MAFSCFSKKFCVSKKLLGGFFIVCLLSDVAWGTKPYQKASDDDSKSLKLVVPSFMSARQKEVNMRRGPGKQYPIDWTIQRVSYPFEVLRTFQDWYQVRDVEGSTGWVNKKMLSQKRFVIVKAEEATLHSAPALNAKPLARVKKGVILPFLELAPDKAWSQVEAPKKRKGYVLTSDIWGV